ncbi:MAG: hypothetical protein ACI9E1_000729 [Cryomorphaceae bacterium]|jgi:hypothetical protein
MKQLLITVVIAVATGISGYFLGVNKGYLADALSSVTQEEKVGRFNSETVFQINPIGYGNTHLSYTHMMMSQFLETQFQIIKSQETLSRAIKDYDLERLLGKSEQELIKEIAERIDVGQVSGTDLVKFKVYANSELKAQQIAYAVMHTYGDSRTEERKKRLKDTIEVFAKKRKMQEAIVEDHRARLYALSKKLQIPYHGKKLKADLIIFNKNVEKLRLDSSMEVCGFMVSAEEKTKFGKVREDYEREMAILDAIKQAEFTEMIGEDLMRDPLVFHQLGWTPEVAAAMKLPE